MAAKTWTVVARGWLMETAIWEALDDDAQHLATCRARIMHLKPGWHVARRSALLVHGLASLGDRPTVPQLLHHRDRPSDRAVSRHERVATLPLQDRAVVRGAPVTAAARTVVDIARREGFRSGLVSADSALREGLDPQQLKAVAARCSGWPGGLNAVRVAAFANGLAESPLESISRAAVHAVGLAVPELQVQIYLGSKLLARVDTLWDGNNLVGEADGKVKYTDVDVFYREKLREQALRAAGFEVVRWDWNEALHAGPEFHAKIRMGLLDGARKQRDPRVRLVRTTVPEALGRRDRGLG